MSIEDRRGANRNWTPLDETGNAPTWERIEIAVLLDLRDELRKLNALLACPNFIVIPQKLARIARNTAKPRKRAIR